MKSTDLELQVMSQLSISIATFKVARKIAKVVSERVGGFSNEGHWITRSPKSM